MAGYGQGVYWGANIDQVYYLYTVYSRILGLAKPTMVGNGELAVQ